jgi:hypothetical protein
MQSVLAAFIVLVPFAGLIGPLVWMARSTPASS